MKRNNRRFKGSNPVTMLILFLVVCIITAGIVWFYTKKYYKDHPIFLENASSQATALIEDAVEQQVNISTETINAGFRDIGTLDTYEYYFTHVSKYSENTQLFGVDVPFSESSYIYSYDGKVTAGMDFSAIKAEVDDENKVITLTLPETQITGFEIDTNSFKLYDESVSIFNPISIGSMGDTLSVMEEEETKKAISKGILTSAEENAVVLVKNFMDGLYEGEGYTVEIVITGSSIEK